MHGNKSPEPGITRVKDMLGGFQQSQTTIEQFIQSGEFDQALAVIEDLGKKVRCTALPYNSTTAEDRACLCELIRRNMESARKVERLMQDARSAHRKSHAALKAYKKY